MLTFILLMVSIPLVFYLFIFKGPGRLDIAAPLYLLRGSKLLVNMTYNILVEVEREGRIGTTNLTILVVEGSIPRPIIT